MSSKKKKVVSQCNSCGCFFLAKDFQEHTAGPTNLSSTPRMTSATAQNPRMVLKSAAQPSKLASPASNVVNSGCKKTSFSDSCVQMIEPKHGMMALEQTIDKRASFLPPEILGWQKYHAALVNPETLRQLECAPRGVAIVEVCDSPPSKSEPVVESSSSESISAFSRVRLCTLWPCSEVPHLRISLPTSGGGSFAGKWVRVSVISSFSAVDSIVLVSSNLFGLPSDFLQQLSSPSSYFSTYLKVYLSQAFIGPEFPVEVFYYGKKLVFHVQKAESTSGNQSVESAIENLKLDSTLPQIYHVSVDASFTVCWEAEDLR